MNLELFHYKQYQNGILIEHKKQHLWIDSQTSKITEQKMEPQTKLLGQFKFSIILGIFNIEQLRYLVICQECELLTMIHEQHLFMIKKVLFVPLQYENQTRQEEHQDILSLRKILQNRFYFSINGDITLSQQRLAKKQESENLFIWNYQMLKPFMEQQISSQWTNPIIYGSIQVIQEKQIILISRLSRKQFFTTGIDEQGNVSHFIETEMIIIKDNQVYSFVCVRGSVPVFWQQERLSQQIKILKSQDLTSTALFKHFNYLKQIYGQVYCLNLLGKSNLTSAYEQHVGKEEYQQIDFQSITKFSYSKINGYIRDLQPIFDNFNYFSPTTSQVGVFRVNRLYCVDSSNIFLSRLFVLFIEKVFSQNILDNFDSKQTNLFLNYKNMWADQADILSQIYFGTNSVNSDYSREDKSQIVSFFNSSIFSISRIMQHKPKQSTLQMLLQGISNKQKQEINQFLENNSQDFSNYMDVQIQVITWNVAGKKPQSELLNIFETSSDILILGLQEMVSLNAKNVVFKSTEKPESYWNSLLQKNLQKHSFMLVQSTSMVGLYLAVLAKPNWMQTISKVQFEQIKTGFQGTLGNKGGIFFSFNIHKTKITICNCHLSSGAKQSQQRLSDLQQIHTQTKMNPEQSDYRILLGDLNFRIEGSYSDITQNIKEYQKENDEEIKYKLLTKLQSMDQLKLYRQQSPQLKLYDEAPLSFLPTYKYDKGTDNYDTSKKQRTPSWCDRIMIGAKQGQIIQQYLYTRIERTDSDHRPVMALYQISIRNVDKQKMLETKQQFHIQNDIK